MRWLFCLFVSATGSNPPRHSTIDFRVLSQASMARTARSPGVCSEFAPFLQREGRIFCSVYIRWFIGRLVWRNCLSDNGRPAIAGGCNAFLFVWSLFLSSSSGHPTKKTDDFCPFDFSLFFVWSCARVLHPAIAVRVDSNSSSRGRENVEFPREPRIARYGEQPAMRSTTNSLQGCLA